MQNFETEDFEDQFKNARIQREVAEINADLDSRYSKFEKNVPMARRAWAEFYEINTNQLATIERLDGVVTRIAEGYFRAQVTVATDETLKVIKEASSTGVAVNKHHNTYKTFPLPERGSDRFEELVLDFEANPRGMMSQLEKKSCWPDEFLPPGFFINGSSKLTPSIISSFSWEIHRRYPGKEDAFHKLEIELIFEKRFLQGYLPIKFQVKGTSIPEDRVIGPMEDELIIALKPATIVEQYRYNPGGRVY